jgi:hypothetical protein
MIKTGETLDHAPIILIHTGASSYLWCVLWQAHRRNPKNEIILIGDWDPRLPFVTFEPIGNHSGSSSRFREVYVPLSTLPHEAQRSNMERWFIVESYVKSRGFTRFVHIDSDLLLFTAIDEHFPRFQGFPWAMGKTSAWSPHVLFFLDTGILERICRFLVDMYVDQDLFARVYKQYRTHRDTHGPGGIGDMAALSIFILEGNEKPYQLNEVEHNAIFDHSVRDSRLSDKREGFRKVGGVKEIVIQDGLPYFIDLESNKVRALTLHFQGGTKHMIPRYVEPLPARIRLEYKAARLRESTKKKLEHMRTMRTHYARGIAKRIRRAAFGGGERGA